jgi:hypothetical protein
VARFGGSVAGVRRAIALPLPPATRSRLIAWFLAIFDGRAGIFNTVFVEAGRVRNGAVHTPEWQRLPWYFTRDLSAMEFPRPALLADMLVAASRVSAGHDHLRVVIFDAGDRFWVGELTG